MPRDRMTLFVGVVLLGFAPLGNRFVLQLNHGAAELEWLSSGTFRFRRTLEGPLTPHREPQWPKVPVQIEDVPEALTLRTRSVVVTLRKRGLLLSVRKPDGAELMSDVSEPCIQGGRISWERAAPEGVRYYGLGTRTDPELDLRGKGVSAEPPLLITSAGYGEAHRGGPLRFDFGSERYRITADSGAIDYTFYYGPNPKEILEEHGRVAGTFDPLPPSTFSVAASKGVRSPQPWSSLRDEVFRLVHGSLSGLLLPELDLGLYANSEPALRERARHLSTLVPLVRAPNGIAPPMRSQLLPYLLAYGEEARDRGLPFLRALPLQFPGDVEALRHPDEFMFGDELLAAPLYTPEMSRSVYLPMGQWTRLGTNERFPGRRTVTVQAAADEIPLFARNGTILPLANAGGLIELHYFPRLGAEFFLLEPDLGEWSQVHAGPAVDVIRLEIESRKDREYEWVVHHIERPKQVFFEEQKYSDIKDASRLRPGAWFYDAQKGNLHVRVRAAANEDRIINLGFE